MLGVGDGGEALIGEALGLRKTCKKQRMEHKRQGEDVLRRSLTQIEEASNKRKSLCEPASAKYYRQGGSQPNPDRAYDYALLQDRAEEETAASKRAKSFVVAATKLVNEQVDNPGRALKDNAGAKVVVGENAVSTRLLAAFATWQNEAETRSAPVRRSAARQLLAKARDPATQEGREWWECTPTSLNIVN